MAYTRRAILGLGATGLGLLIAGCQRGEQPAPEAQVYQKSVEEKPAEPRKLTDNELLEMYKAAIPQAADFRSDLDARVRGAAEKARITPDQMPRSYYDNLLGPMKTELYGRSGVKELFALGDEPKRRALYELSHKLIAERKPADGPLFYNGDLPLVLFGDPGLVEITPGLQFVSGSAVLNKADVLTLENGIKVVELKQDENNLAAMPRGAPLYAPLSLFGSEPGPYMRREAREDLILVGRIEKSLAAVMPKIRKDMDEKAVSAIINGLPDELTDILDTGLSGPGKGEYGDVRSSVSFQRDVQMALGQMSEASYTLNIANFPEKPLTYQGFMDAKRDLIVWKEFLVKIAAGKAASKIPGRPAN